MKKLILLTLLLTSCGSDTATKELVRIENQGEAVQGPMGDPGEAGGSCHVKQLSKGCALIFCDDGSEAQAGKCNKD